MRKSFLFTKIKKGETIYSFLPFQNKKSLARQGFLFVNAKLLLYKFYSCTIVNLHEINTVSKVANVKACFGTNGNH
jgi:hypothetical protein